MMQVKIYNQSGNELPSYQTENSAGMDIRADFSRVTPTNLLKVYGESEFIFEGTDINDSRPAMLRLEPGSRALIPTGLFIALPEGFEAQVRPRSGLALKEGVTVLNTPGTIDADYRGEIGIIVINHGTQSIWIEDSERIAQLVISPIVMCEWNEVFTKSDLSETSRGECGFGHTNKN